MNSPLGKEFLQHIEKGELDGVNNLLGENYNINLDERDQDGQTFLMIACRLKQVEIVRRLLEELSVSDVNAVDNDDWSSLLNASKEGSPEIVKMLLDAGASIEHRDMAGWTALMWASYKGWSGVAQVLLERDANPNVKGEHHMSCLTWAAGRGHSEVVNLLLRFGAKVNTADKYGTTPLIWAARKGHYDIVSMLLKEGAVVDKAGMNSWTALIVASSGGYASVVKLLLEHHPNVNAVDKDGYTALSMAAKEGYVEIVSLLLQNEAYGNITDREGDTILIHAVKNNHTDVVKLLLKKYADIDVTGVDSKTALFWAVEKGHYQMVKLLLDNNANLEIPNKDGDTPLLKAVRNRNLEIVQLLVDKSAKVSATDKRGDNCLHISVRSRSKRITEYLLRNPKNSKLLYNKNKKGETAYGIDAGHERSLLAQVFGAKNLNADDNMQGYELYSATIADVLGEPSLRTPITVGLFARWGSGKSSMIKRLRAEMESYASWNVQPRFNITFIFILFSFIVSSVFGLVVGLIYIWPAGLGIAGSLFLALLVFYGLSYFGAVKRDWSAAVNIIFYLSKQFQFVSLLSKVIFCNVPEQKNRDTAPIRFIFTDSAHLNTIMGEKSIISIISTLCDAIENDYGVIITRLFKIFKPKKASEHGRFKSLCCIPYFVLVIFILLVIITASVLICVLGFDKNFSSERTILTNGIILALFTLAGIFILGNIYLWCRTVVSLVIPTRKQIQKINSKGINDVNKLDAVVPLLKKEVDHIGWMVRTMDSFTGNHSRLVVVVDGLDSCEQDKLLNVLDLVNILFGNTNSPFVIILAIDPHVIIKGIEHNIHSQFRDTSINGHDYLRNIVQLPFFIQSQCLPKPPVRNVTKLDIYQNSDVHGVAFNCHRQESQISGASYLSLTDVGKSKAGRRNKLSISNPLSNSTTLLRQPSLYDLSKSLNKTSYFSDINPRNMKRLMNILAVTGRLLRAFNVEFNWYKLASWINLTEQWPYRLSWLILEVEDHENIEDSQNIKFIYDRVSHKIPLSRDVDPLVEIDRNVRKLEVFLANNSPPITVADMKRFLPCTINVDPYLRKLIRELQQNAENLAGELMYNNQMTSPMDARNWMRVGQYGTLGSLTTGGTSAAGVAGASSGLLRRRNHSGSPSHTMPPMMMGPPNYFQHPYLFYPPPMGTAAQTLAPPSLSVPVNIKGNMPKKSLARYTCDDLCRLMEQLDGLSADMLDDYIGQLKANNINGIVLSNCDLNELKSNMKMKFGDWELFRCLIEMLRNMEMQQLQQQQQHDPTSSSDMNQSLTATNLFNSANESTVTGREPSPKPRFQTNSASGVLESAAEKAKRLASDSCNTLAGNSMESMNNISSIGLVRSQQQQQQQQQQPYIPSTAQMMKAISKEQEMDFKNFNISKQQQQQQQQLQQQQPIPPQSLSLFTKPQQNYQLSLQQQQLMRQDSFVNEVMMEAEALINIVEATGVETNSESDESEDGDAGAGEGGHRTGAISPIPEEDTLSNPIQTSSHSSFVSLAKHAVLSRQASQDSATNIGDRAFFVGPDNDSGESDSEEVERLSHKNSVMRRQQTTKSPHHSVAGDVAASVAASAAAAAAATTTTTTTTGAGCIVIGNASSGINDANYQVNRDSKKTALKRPDLTRASTDSTAPLLNRTYSEDASHALVFNNSFAVSGLNGTDASEANNSGYKSAFVTLNSGIIFQPTSLKSDQKEMENKDEQDSSYKITIDF